MFLSLVALFSVLLSGVVQVQADSDYDRIFSDRELEAVSLTGLVLGGLSFLVLLVSLVYHHRGLGSSTAANKQPLVSQV